MTARLVLGGGTGGAGHPVTARLVLGGGIGGAGHPVTDGDAGIGAEIVVATALDAVVLGAA